MEPLQFLTELRAKSQGISPDSRSSDPFRSARDAARARSARDPCRLPPRLCRSPHGPTARRWATPLRPRELSPRPSGSPPLPVPPPGAPWRAAGGDIDPGPKRLPPDLRPPRNRRVVSAAPPPPAANGCAAGDSAVQRCHVSHARRSADGHSISVRSHRPLPRFVLSGALGINRPQELRKPAVRCASLRDCRQHCRDRYRRREAAAHYDRRGRRRPWMLV